MKKRFSYTALTAAIMRGTHLRLDGEPKVFRDELALRLCGTGAIASFVFAMIRMRLSSKSRAAMEPMPYMEMGRYLRAAMVMRSRHTEDLLIQAIDRGISQFVILGAGLDSFAYRRRDLAAIVNTFEVDHPASQQWKQRRLRKLSVALPPNLTFVPIDFETQTLTDGLRKGGFLLAKPAFFSWLGVTQYISREAVCGTLREISELAPGTEIVFTYVMPQTLLSSEDRRIFVNSATPAAARGERWMTFFNPAEIDSCLHEIGFDKVVDFSPDEANARYFRGRSDGLRLPGLEHIVRAQVVDRPQSAQGGRAL
jgi:methyltransferase (TIGR00027 family)